eukprot:CAMPEP_0177393272 /NCGR_PEP_ID=MMETSP0368-20130122/54861_1 /TAXON_ID=447022 ORGANISM="Scrippsiella hangoei-like, Strain SHHI-4" /NCGR_SAMPLE_ID=MMETSP0368 /ASSEMBLY_ACC=CAM_ASM_000363 /LENGTH=49 /DNA_ID= /DNA_START= /DNA_END= /DNA_ORIENTATION=
MANTPPNHGHASATLGPGASDAVQLAHFRPVPLRSAQCHLGVAWLGTDG